MASRGRTGSKAGVVVKRGAGGRIMGSVSLGLVNAKGKPLSASTIKSYGSLAANVQGMTKGVKLGMPLGQARALYSNSVARSRGATTGHVAVDLAGRRQWGSQEVRKPNVAIHSRASSRVMRERILTAH